MGPKVQIVVLTRFSVYNFPSDLISDLRPDITTHEAYIDYIYSEERLNSKLSAFQAVTIPSIKAQTYKNFKWYIIYSEHLPIPYITALKRAIRDVPHTKLMQVKQFSEVNAAVKDILPASPYISVNIDDDDAFNPRYFKLLAETYSPGIILTPTTGYMLSKYDFNTRRGIASEITYPKKECAASGLAYADNNVLTLGNHTIVHKAHKDNIHYFTEKGLFIRLINGSNISNAKHKNPPFKFSFSKFLYPHRATRKQRGGGLEIGEGRSKSIYIEPMRKDTAVLLAFYNPAGFQRILNNILYIIKILKEKNIPVYVAECVFNGAAPQIPGANLILDSNSYMFYKEQLLNKLEAVVPEEYTKLVMLDGDIIFDSPDWLDQISVALDTKDIIQPYLKACWLQPDNRRINSWKYSYGYAITNNIKINHMNLHRYHPGFAWAFRRETFRKLGGFYPNAIIGNGDMLFAYNFFKDEIPEFWIKETLKTLITIEAWPAYHENFKLVAPKLGYIDVRALHLFHGLSSNRQYKTRYLRFANIFTNNWDSYIKLNADGLTEFKDPELRGKLLDYFKDRNEDIPLKEANEKSFKRFRRTRRMRFKRIVTPPDNTVPEVNLNGNPITA